jgi:hypothetical protein
MSVFLSLVSVVGFVGVISALVAVVRGRLRWARISNRKVAAYVFAGSFVLFVAASAGAGATGTKGNANVPTNPVVTPSSSPQTSNEPSNVPTATSVTATPVTTNRTAVPAPVLPPPPRTTVAPAPPPPPPPDPLTCTASMSNPQPADNTETDVIVRTGVAGAEVTTTAHYKTTDTTHQAATAPNGDADIAYRISRATPGYTVTVDVTVTADGTSQSCSTSFTPVA